MATFPIEQERMPLLDANRCVLEIASVEIARNEDIRLWNVTDGIVPTPLKNGLRLYGSEVQYVIRELGCRELGRSE